MRMNKTLLAVVIGAAFPWPHQALAEEEATLSGVVVSASKIEQSTLEAPATCRW